MKTNTHSHKRQAVNIGFLVGGLVWLVISGTSSFGFFYTYLPSIVPGGIAGSIAPVISGAMGVALFDVAGILWLAVYLHHTETAAQRAIAMIMAVVTFAGSVAATVAYFALEATSGGSQLILLETNTANVIGWFALATVILGSALNFIGYNLYNSQSLENQRRIRDDNQRDVIQAAEDEAGEYLTDLVTSGVKARIKESAQRLADEEAAYLVGQYQMQRRARFATDVQPGLPAPTTPADQDEFGEIRRQQAEAGLTDDDVRAAVAYGRSLRDADGLTADDLQLAIDQDRRRDEAERLARIANRMPASSGELSPELQAFLRKTGRTADQVRNLARSFGLTDPDKAYRKLQQYGQLPDGMTRSEFDALFDELMHGAPRPTERLASNGNGRH